MTGHVVFTTMVMYIHFYRRNHSLDGYTCSSSVWFWLLKKHKCEMWHNLLVLIVRKLRQESWEALRQPLYLICFVQATGLVHTCTWSSLQLLDTALTRVRLSAAVMHQEKKECRLRVSWLLTNACPIGTAYRCCFLYIVGVLSVEMWKVDDCPPWFIVVAFNRSPPGMCLSGLHQRSVVSINLTVAEWHVTNDSWIGGMFAAMMLSG